VLAFEASIRVLPRQPVPCLNVVDINVVDINVLDLKDAPKMKDAAKMLGYPTRAGLRN